MATDNQGAPPSEPPKKSPPRRVVVTYGGKQKKAQEGVPTEILPQDSTKVINSFIETQSAMPTMPQDPNIEMEIPVTKPKETFSQTAGSSEQIQQTRPNFLPVLSLFMGTIALGAVSVLAFNIYGTQKTLNEMQTKMYQENASAQVLIEQNQSTLNKLKENQQSMQSEQQSLVELKKQIEVGQQKWVELSGDTEWVLAEANYLVFMANEKLQFSQDVNSAIVQLEAADNRLAKLANPAFNNIRAALAKDLAKLRQLPPVNKQQRWDQIEGLSSLLNEMHFKTIAPAVVKVPMLMPPEGPAWRQSLWHSWQELKGLVRVSRVEQNGISLALTVQEQEQILRTLQLMCLQTQWAILQSNPKIYLSNLASLQAWVEQYFVNDAAQEKVLAAIEALKKHPVQSEIPLITDSLQALNQAMKNATSPQTNPGSAPQ